jgi:hypothetical protein
VANRIEEECPLCGSEVHLEGDATFDRLITVIIIQDPDVADGHSGRKSASDTEVYVYAGQIEEDAALDRVLAEMNEGQDDESITSLETLRGLNWRVDYQTLA